MYILLCCCSVGYDIVNERFDVPGIDLSNVRYPAYQEHIDVLRRPSPAVPAFFMHVLNKSFALSNIEIVSNTFFFSVYRYRTDYPTPQTVLMITLPRNRRLIKFSHSQSFFRSVLLCDHRLDFRLQVYSKTAHLQCL